MSRLPPRGIPCVRFRRAPRRELAVEHQTAQPGRERPPGTRPGTATRAADGGRSRPGCCTWTGIAGGKERRPQARTARRCRSAQHPVACTGYPLASESQSGCRSTPHRRADAWLSRWRVPPRAFVPLFFLGRVALTPCRPGVRDARTDGQEHDTPTGPSRGRLRRPAWRTCVASSTGSPRSSHAR